MSEDNQLPETGTPALPAEEKLSRVDEWNKHIAEVKAFAQDKQRWPSTTAEDQVEKTLAQWWSRQKYYFKKHEQGEKSPGINDKRADIMRGLIASFGSFERDGVWDTRYHLVQMQLKSHGKLWSYKTDDGEEEQVLRWWNQQKTFYRKFRKGEKSGGMTEERALKVENVLRLLGQQIIPRDPNVGA
jgi:hypothetical protein